MNDGRRPLATSQFVLPHTARAPQNHYKPIDTAEPITAAECSHYFLDPLSWMKSELEQGKLDGRLECPKCNTNVGKYAWQGMRCSCGVWIVPGISLAKSRIDEFKVTSLAPRSMGIRMPPATIPNKGSGQENL